MRVNSVAVVYINGISYAPISFTMSADNNWTPTWQGTATFTSDRAPKVDPRDYPLARIKWYYGEWVNTPIIMDCLVFIRSTVTDDIAGTVTLTFLSAEVLLQDDKNVSTSDFQPGAQTTKALFEYNMARLVQRWGITWDSGQVAATALPATATVWKAGQDADSRVRPNRRPQNLDVIQTMDPGTLDSAGVRLATWLTTNAGKGSSAQSNAIYGRNILEARFGTDIDNGGWADGATVNYSWVDSAGATRKKSYRSFSTANYRKSATIEFASADPGYDPSPSMLAIAQRRGYTGELVLTPGPAFSGGAVAIPHQLGGSIAIQRKDGSLYSATVSRIEWSYPDDRITLSLENVAVKTTPITPLPLP